jgi:Skp family chaperone for outer membrane proteins
VKTNRAAAAKPKKNPVGCVDMDKVFESYAPLRKAQQAMEDTQQKYQQQFMDQAQKKFKTTDIGKLTPKQQADAERMYQDTNTKAEKELDKIYKKQVEPAKKKIQKSISDVAKQKSLDVVLDKKMVLSGGVDITKPVLARLKK